MDIAVWLLGLGLEQYEPAFRANEIDTSVLPRLTAVGNREETAMSRLLKFRWLQIAVLFSNVIGFGLFSAPAGAAGDTVHLTAPHRQTGSGQFLITTLSARNDLLSGDSALIRVGVSSAIPLTQVGVYLNGVKVTSAFQETPPGSHVLQGLATGLRRGDNTLLIRDERNQSTSSQLTLTDYPITGPILSGPHITPYECRTTQNGLGSPLDSDCSAATKIAYYYRSTSKTFKALTRPTGPRPTDLALTTTTDGRTVPYIVRVESGTINRGVYRIAILDDPAQSSTGPWKPGFGWNGKLVVTFGCCGSAQYNQGVISPDAILSDTELSRGFAFAHSTELFNQQHANPHLQGETLMILKDYFIKNYGVPKLQSAAARSRPGVDPRSLEVRPEADRLRRLQGRLYSERTGSAAQHLSRRRMRLLPAWDRAAAAAGHIFARPISTRLLQVRFAGWSGRALIKQSDLVPGKRAVPLAFPQSAQLRLSRDEFSGSRNRHRHHLSTTLLDRPGRKRLGPVVTMRTLNFSESSRRAGISPYRPQYRLPVQRRAGTAARDAGRGPVSPSGRRSTNSLATRASATPGDRRKPPATRLEMAGRIT